MRLRVAVTLFSLLIFVSLAFAAVIMDGSFSAAPSGSKIMLRWVSSDETGVAKYDISRATGYDGQFVYLESVRATGSGSSYEYLDNTVFKTTDNLYKYAVTPRTGTGAQVGVSFQATCSLNISGVRRTWGSIKAMFR